MTNFLRTQTTTFRSGNMNSFSETHISKERHNGGFGKFSLFNNSFGLKDRDHDFSRRDHDFKPVRHRKDKFDDYSLRDSRKGRDHHCSLRGGHKMSKIERAYLEGKQDGLEMADGGDYRRDERSGRDFSNFGLFRGHHNKNGELPQQYPGLSNSNFLVKAKSVLDMFNPLNFLK